MQQQEAVPAFARHPRDPEPVPSTKAAAAYALSIIAVILSPFIGGVIPAVIAMRLAKQADHDIAESEGFLLGAKRVFHAKRLAILAFAIAGAVILAGILWWVYLLVGMPSEAPNLPSNVD